MSDQKNVFKNGVSSGNSESSKLIRSLGLNECIAIVVGSIIGTGVFLKTGIMTQTVQSPSIVMLAWVVAGLLSLAGALTYAELGSLFPKAGGEYIYLQKTYGNAVSFLYGWMRFWIGSPGSIAAYSVGAATFLGALVAYPNDSAKVSMAILFICVFTFLNCLAVKFGGKLQVFLTILKVFLIGGLIFGAMFLSGGSVANFSLQTEFAGMSAFGTAMLAALWAYDGWNNLGMASGEVKDPQKNIPRALILGVFSCIAIYCLVNLAYFVALPVSEILSANSKNFPEALPVATKAVKIFMGDQGITVLSVAFVISALGAMNGSILTSARVPFAMAEAGAFPKIFAFIHSQSKTPVISIIVQGLIACGLALSGTFDQLTDYVVFSAWLFYAMNGVAVMLLRKRMPNAERAYKVPLYPVIPILSVTLSVLLLINTLVTAPNESGMGLLIIALGLPVYWLFFRSTAHKA